MVPCRTYLHRHSVHPCGDCFEIPLAVLSTDTQPGDGAHWRTEGVGHVHHYPLQCIRLQDIFLKICSTTLVIYPLVHRLDL
jgi:hypothetical protein